MASCVQKCVVVKHHAFRTNTDASNKLQVGQTVKFYGLLTVYDGFLAGRNSNRANVNSLISST